MDESPTSVHEETAITMAAVVPDVDLISDLHDDILLRILSFLPSSGEVARTSVLSKRWRHLWPNAAALRFTVGSEPAKAYCYTQADRDEARRLIAAADAVLASRSAADGPDVQDLEVSLVYSSEHNTYIDSPHIGYIYRHYHAADITSAHVASWLEFAARRVSRRFTIAVPTVPKRRPRNYYPMADDEVSDDEEDEEAEGGAAAAVPEEEEEEEEDEEDEGGAAAQEVEDGASAVAEEEAPAAAEEEDRVLTAELPSSTRAQEMNLTLGKAILTVPHAGAGSFAALTDVLLSHARINAAGDGDDHRLGRLFSSSCSPALRRLQLRYIDGLTELRLDAAATLSELRLRELPGLEALDVAAPGLRALGVNGSFRITSARISAPWLEALACEVLSPAERLCFDGAASVRRIEDLHLPCVFIVGPSRDERVAEEDEYNAFMSAALWLLRHCTAMDRLCVELVWPHYSLKELKEMMHGEEEVHFEDNLMRIPQLSNMRNLKIKLNVPWSDGHPVGATIVKLITKCPELEDLSIEIRCSRENCLDPNCICKLPEDWERQKLSFERLRKVDFRYFEPFESQIQLVGLLLTTAPALERMTLALHTRTYQGSVAVPFKIPCYGGCWLPNEWEHDYKLGITVATKYEWTRVRREGEEGECADLDGLCICNMGG